MPQVTEPDPTTVEHDTTVADTVTSHADDDDLVVEELLVEEVSIDGMCGVY